MADDTQVAPTGGFRPWAVGLMQMAGGGLEILLGAGRVATPHWAAHQSRFCAST